MLKLELGNNLTELSRLVVALEQFAAEQHLSHATLDNLNLVLEEMFVNIVRYGDCEGQPIVIEVESQNGNVTARISDNGSYFNPLDYSPSNCAAFLDEWRVGGLGIYLVKQLTDEATYVREGEQNIMTVKLGNCHQLPSLKPV